MKEVSLTRAGLMKESLIHAGLSELKKEMKLFNKDSIREQISVTD